MRAARRQRRAPTGKARLRLNDVERSGNLVMEAIGVSYARDGGPLVRDLDTLILRGDKVGIIGPNGAAKNWSWTSPPTTWTPRPSSCSKSCWSASREPYCW